MELNKRMAEHIVQGKHHFHFTSIKQDANFPVVFHDCWGTFLPHAETKALLQNGSQNKELSSASSLD